MDNNNEQPEEKKRPVVVMGNMAFQLSDILNMDNNPEVKTAIESWLAKKEKAFDRAERKTRKASRKRK